MRGGQKGRSSTGALLRRYPLITHTHTGARTRAFNPTHTVVSIQVYANTHMQAYIQMELKISHFFELLLQGDIRKPVFPATGRRLMENNLTFCISVLHMKTKPNYQFDQYCWNDNWQFKIALIEKTRLCISAVKCIISLSSVRMSSVLFLAFIFSNCTLL